MSRLPFTSLPLLTLLSCGVSGCASALSRGSTGPAPLVVSAAYTIDAFHNVAGGEGRGGALLHNADLTVALDAESLLGVSGLDAFVYLLGNAGGSITDHIGDAQGASNIEAPAALRLYEAWIQKRWGDAFSALFGLYDLNSEFYVARTGTLFLNSSHGIGPEFAGSGRNGPSIFPVTSLAARVRWTPGAAGFYAQGAALDGVPGDPDDPGATRIALREEEGVLLAVEIGYASQGRETGRYRKVLFGGWHYTAAFDHALDPGVTENGTFGVYALGEAELHRETPDGGQGLAAYARVGYADRDVHPVSWSWSAGATYTGLLPGRDADVAGVGVATAALGADYVRARANADDDVLRSEIALEATYALRASSWLLIQPDVQYIIQPGMDPDLPDALVVGMRVQVAFD